MNKYPIYKAKYPIKIKNNMLTDICFYSTLTKREISDLFSLYTSKNTQMLYTLKASLSDEKIIDYLSDKEVETLYKEILSVSIPTKEQLDTFKSVFTLSNDENLQSETWGCEICKERGLQESRACGFIPEEKRDKGFKIYAGGEIHTICPIYKIMKYSDLMNAGYEAYKYYRKGLMPEFGGSYDQTMWFLELSILLDNLIKKAQADAMKKD